MDKKKMVDYIKVKMIENGKCINCAEWFGNILMQKSYDLVLDTYYLYHIGLNREERR